MKKLVVAGVILVAAGLLFPHLSAILGWHNTLTGGTFNVSQANSLCGNPLVQELTKPGSVQATDCGEAATAQDVFNLVVFAGLATLGVAGYLRWKAA